MTWRLYGKHKEHKRGYNNYSKRRSYPCLGRNITARDSGYGFLLEVIGTIPIFFRSLGLIPDLLKREKV